MDIAILLIRVGIGATLAAHGAQKLFGWFQGHGIARTAGFLESLGSALARPTPGLAPRRLGPCRRPVDTRGRHRGRGGDGGRHSRRAPREGILRRGRWLRVPVGPRLRRGGHRLRRRRPVRPGPRLRLVAGRRGVGRRRGRGCDGPWLWRPSAAATFGWVHGGSTTPPAPDAQGPRARGDQLPLAPDFFEEAA